MSEQPQFTVKVDQNKFLPVGGREVHAIVSVESAAADGAPVPSATRASEVVILEDLTGRRTESAPQAGDYPLGAWGAESRDYHVCVEVPPGEVGKELRAAWVKLVVPGAPGEEAQVLASGNVLAQWTDDEARSTRINARVAHYTGQAELAAAIQEGLQARKDGDLGTATSRLGRAVVLAGEAGNDAITAMLRKVVDVVDPATGTVRLKRDIDKADEMELDTRSSKTVRTRKDETVTNARGEG
jgi:hypothetical protein